MEEAISLAKELNDKHSLAVALMHNGILRQYERAPDEVERSASALIELSTRQSFAFFFGWRNSSSRLGALCVG